jgi:hypothetical protein
MRTAVIRSVLSIVPARLRAAPVEHSVKRRRSPKRVWADDAQPRSLPGSDHSHLIWAKSEGKRL